MAMGLLLTAGYALAQAEQQPSAPAASAMSAAEIEAMATLRACFECHGETGISRDSARPNIAGQKAEYLSRQLFTFRRSSDALSSAKDADAKEGDNNDGGGVAKPPASRSDPLMSHMAAGLSDSKISHIARALSQMPCDGGKAKPAPATPPVKPPVALRCESCHGETGISSTPHVPNIAGQQRGYLRRQLLIIRENAWGADSSDSERWRTHPIMERQAARISIEEVDALAQYYAALDCRGAPAQ